MRLNKTGTDYNSVYLDQIQINITYTAGTPTAPGISNVNVSEIMAVTAVINWTTNLASNSTVRYGTTTALGSSQTSATYTTSKDIALSSLSSSTLYYYNITSCDLSGNCITSGTFTFATSASTPSHQGSGGGTVGGCTETWLCGNWGDCQPDGTTTRTCTDVNECGTIRYRPNITTKCRCFRKRKMTL